MHDLLSQLHETESNKTQVLAVPGKHIKLRSETDFNDTIAFLLVEEDNSNSLANKFSYKSPIGKAVFERQKGDIITLDIDGEKQFYRIIEIS